MANLGETFEVSALPQGNTGNFDPLPPGWYSATMSAAEIKNYAQFQANEIKAAEAKKIESLRSQAKQHEDNLKFAAARHEAMLARIEESQKTLTDIEQQKAALKAKLG